MDAIFFLWREIIERPMLNSLVVLYTILFSNFGLSIIFFTIVIRLVTMPLTLKQLRQTRAMSSLQPKLREVQRKYAKDRQKVSQETMRLYKEHGVNPIGCLGPLVIQFPIWIGLYRSIIQTLPSSPESLAGLSTKLYSWLPLVNEAVPLNSRFLWLDLALSDPTPVFPVLVGMSMWLQQKMTILPTSDPRQQQQNTMLLWMMPIMFTFFAFTFPSGLSLYWIISNLIGIVIQYFVTGWGSLFAPRMQQETAPIPVVTSPAEETMDDGNARGNSQDGGRGHRARSKAARRRARGGRNRRR